jgi:hypothetical protein
MPDQRPSPSRPRRPTPTEWRRFYAEVEAAAAGRRARKIEPPDSEFEGLTPTQVACGTVAAALNALMQAIGASDDIYRLTARTGLAFHNAALGHLDDLFKPVATAGRSGYDILSNIFRAYVLKIVVHAAKDRADQASQASWRTAASDVVAELRHQKAPLTPDAQTIRDWWDQVEHPKNKAERHLANVTHHHLARPWARRAGTTIASRVTWAIVAYKQEFEQEA